MRRRVASPVPPFDAVPFHVVAVAKRVFLVRIRSLETRLMQVEAAHFNPDPVSLPPAGGGFAG
jgi:hypothetical protein